MDDLTTWLKRFNAKERMWVIENAIGPTSLSAGFCARVTKALNLSEPITTAAWWSIDYHIDWLFAALRCHELGDSWSDDNLIEESSDHYSYGIEDIDLVICDKNRILMIEAKAYGAWGSKQIDSKMQRLTMLAERAAVQGVDLYFVLMSPRPPQKLKYDAWYPGWIADGLPTWIELEAPLKRGLVINRCDESGALSAKGEFYQITRHSTG